MQFPMVSTISPHLSRGWKSGGYNYRPQVSASRMQSYGYQIEGRNWQQPPWLKSIFTRPYEFGMQIARYGEGKLPLIPPEVHADQMFMGRIVVSRALAFIYLNILQAFWPEGVPKVVEMGCGPFLSLYEVFPHQELPSQWHAFDIAPFFVRVAKERAAQNCWPVALQAGSAYEPPFSPADVFIGQSSYDSIFNLPAALVAAKNCLKPGGLFIHLQEVNPVFEAVFPFLLNMPDYPRECLTEVSEDEFQDDRKQIEQFLSSHNVHPDEARLLIHPMEWTNKMSKFVYQLPDGRLVSCIDEFQDRLMIAARSSGFEMLADGVAAAEYSGPFLSHHELLLDIDYPYVPTGKIRANSVIRQYPMSFMEFIPEIDEGWVHEDTIVRYLIARNPG